MSCLSEHLEAIAIARVFSRAAKTYDDAAILHRAVSERLFDRLAPIRIMPNAILDLGCNTGRDTQKLISTYPVAIVYAYDLAQGMLAYALSSCKTVQNKNVIGVNGRAEQLPFADNTFDMVYSNLVLPWCHYRAVFEEVARVLRVGGVWIFSTYGPDTLQELRQAWQGVDDYPHVHDFLEMHHVGDMLMKARLVEPVIEREFFSLSYQRIKTVCQDLRALGAVNQRDDRRKTCLGKKRWALFQQAYESMRTEEGYLPLTYEVIYAHAWKTAPVFKTTSGITKIPISVLKK